MRRNNKISTALIFSLMLSTSGCATYQSTDGTHYADPRACRDVCAVLIVGVMAGLGAAVAGHH